MSLQQKGVCADYLGSMQKNPSVLPNAQNGIYDLLYLTPERANTLGDR
jgi:ATP-dependent DNA helicase RecQ